MGFRSDLDAARLRAEALSDENRALRDELAKLKEPGGEAPRGDPAMEALAEATLDRLERLSYEPPSHAEDQGLVELTPIAPPSVPKRPPLHGPKVDDFATDPELAARAARYVITPRPHELTVPEPPPKSFASGVALGVSLGVMIGFLLGALVMR